MTAPGEILLGKYRVERELGRGGMGVVLSARHIELDEPVAIKLLLPSYVTNPEVVARFIREAKAAARIKSEHVARVSDVGRLPTGEPYMVMEHLTGQDLEAILESRGQLPIADICDYLLQAMQALAEAHSMKIVHRDLKPANIFLTRRTDGSPCVKVLDFGISKFAATDGHAMSSMTRTQGMMGSPLYMSPEQLQSPKDVDARSDIWSLGVIAYQLATASYPFIAESIPQLVAQVFNVEPAMMSASRADVPPGFEAVVRKCLAKAASNRYRNVAELAMALAPLGSRRAQASLDSIVGTLGVPSEEPRSTEIPPQRPAAAQTNANWGATANDSALPVRSRAPLAIALAAFLVLGIAATAWSLHGRPEPHPSVAAPAATSAFEAERPATTAETTAAPTPTATGDGAAPTPTPTAHPQPMSPPLSVKTPSKPAPSASAKPAPSGSVGPKIKPGCSPAYFYDDDGIKRWKKECM